MIPLTEVIKMSKKNYLLTVNKEDGSYLSKKEIIIDNRIVKTKSHYFFGPAPKYLRDAIITYFTYLIAIISLMALPDLLKGTSASNSSIKNIYLILNVLCLMLIVSISANHSIECLKSEPEKDFKTSESIFGTIAYVVFVVLMVLIVYISYLKYQSLNNESCIEPYKKAILLIEESESNSFEVIIDGKKEKFSKLEVHKEQKCKDSH